jgi:hypothetical protein
MYGRSEGWRLGWDRFRPGILKVLEDVGHPVHQCVDAVEYALLTHCPHLNRLADAQEKWNIFQPYFQR